MNDFFTKQERTVLYVLVSVLIFGNIINYSFRKYPQIKNIINAVEKDEFFRRIDINHATKDQLISVPYIGEYTADNIVKYRSSNGLFNELEELKKVKGIRDKNYERFVKYLKVDK